MKSKRDGRHNEAAYGGIFPTRLRRLMDDGGVTGAELARKAGISRQSVSSYCNGVSVPDAPNLAKIADFFGVTVAYLQGVTDDPSPQPSAVDDLGLPPEAVRYIQAIKACRDLPGEHGHYSRLDLLGDLLSDKTVDAFLASCVRYVNLKLTPGVDEAFLTSADFTAMQDKLSAHGLVIADPAVELADEQYGREVIPDLDALLNHVIESERKRRKHDA